MIDIDLPTAIHVVGVGGPGMSALARVLAQMGHRVSGSDIRVSPVMEKLRLDGVTVHIGHDVDHVRDARVVVYSTAVPVDNIELVAGRSRGLDVVHRSEMLAAVCRRARTIGVAGTHGKTTTSALLVRILAGAGTEPSWLVGAEMLGDGGAAHWSDRGLFIVEADESDGTHAELPLWGSIITNLDKDHLDHFGTLDGLRSSFVSYANSLEGPIVFGADDPELRTVLARLDDRTHGQVILAGSTADAAVRLVDARPVAEGQVLVVRQSAGGEVQCRLPLHGRHNALNAVTAIAMASAVGVPIQSAAQMLESFAGVERRLEHKGRVNDAVIVDDYAHVPAEIQATITAVRSKYGNGSRIVAVFQPNRYHRIAAMHADYADCFEGADAAVITEIYPSGTEPIAGVSGKLVHDAVICGRSPAEVVWAPTREDVVEHLLNDLRPGDVCLGMGCGDIASLADDLHAASVSREAGST